jgi:hypothetical protein
VKRVRSSRTSIEARPGTGVTDAMTTLEQDFASLTDDQLRAWRDSLPEEQLLEVQHQTERRAVEENFLEFLKHVKVQDPPPGLGIRSFEMWNYLMETADTLVNNRLVAWIKVRQIGATTLLAAFVYWYCYQDYAVCPLFSQGEAEAQKFLGKVNVIHQNLPDHLRLDTARGKRIGLSKMEFANGSTVEAMSSTEKSGRSITASLVVFDEFDFHEYAEENYAAAKPIIDEVLYDEDGSPREQRFQRKLIAISTPHPTRMESTFKTICRGAPDNGFKLIYHSWDVRPGRDQQWYDDRRSEATDLSMFEKEYSRTIEEALSPGKAASVFDYDTLTWMKELTAPAFLKIDPIEVFIKRRAGGRYAGASDPAHGGGGDFSCSGIMDFSGQQAVVVADIMRDDLGPQDLAFETMRMLAMYNNPIWAIEDNDWGIECINAAKTEGYRRLYRRKTSKNNRKDGWHTDGHSRWVMWSGLTSVVNSGALRVYNEKGLAQFFTIVRVGADSKPEAMGGAHDDYPTMCAIAYQMRDHTYAVEGNPDVPVKLPAYF